MARDDHPTTIPTNAPTDVGGIEPIDDSQTEHTIVVKTHHLLFLCLMWF